MTTGLAVFAERVWRQRCRLLSPPPKLTISEWADTYRHVPNYSAEPGQWVTDRTPYLREVMDAFNEPKVNRVVFKKCARIGATEAGLNIVGYFIHQDPSSIMIVQPTVDDAKDFSKEQLGPTIDETDVLRALVSNAVKDSKNTITAKVFPGGSVVLGGANSPRFFRRRTVRLLILEEINGYGGSLSATREGSQIKLAEKRTETLGYRRKIYLNSTPTTKGECEISYQFDNSDQRHLLVPCPHCGERQELQWDRLMYKERESPVYLCSGKGCEIDEGDKDAMVAQGQWVPYNPGHSTRGYTINALYSPFVRWARLVEEWLEAQGDPEALRVFVNTALGEAWEDRVATDQRDTMAERAKAYDPSGSWSVPRAACVVVAGVDKQDAELHAVARAYGPGEQSWLLDWVVFRGDTSQPEVWSALDEWLLTKSWRHEGGALLKVRAVCVDSGDDPQPVYAFTKARLARYVFAIKGASDPNADILPKKPTRTSIKSRLYVIGTQNVKKRLLRRASVNVPNPYTLDVGPGFFHVNERADSVYLSELYSQKLIRHQFRGKTVTMYVKRSGERDEKLDCEVYAYAALQLGPVPLSGLHDEWARVMALGETTVKPVSAVATTSPVADDSESRWSSSRAWMSRIRD